jgi:hypothetical protein
MLEEKVVRQEVSDKPILFRSDSVVDYDRVIAQLRFNKTLDERNLETLGLDKNGNHLGIEVSEAPEEYQKAVLYTVGVPKEGRAYWHQAEKLPEILLVKEGENINFEWERTHQARFLHHNHMRKIVNLTGYFRVGEYWIENIDIQKKGSILGPKSYDVEATCTAHPGHEYYSEADYWRAEIIRGPIEDTGQILPPKPVKNRISVAKKIAEFLSTLNRERQVLEQDDIHELEHLDKTISGVRNFLNLYSFDERREWYPSWRLGNLPSKLREAKEVELPFVEMRLIERLKEGEVDREILIKSEDVELDFEKFEKKKYSVEDVFWMFKGLIGDSYLSIEDPINDPVIGALQLCDKRIVQRIFEFDKFPPIAGSMVGKTSSYEDDEKNAFHIMKEFAFVAYQLPFSEQNRFADLMEIGLTKVQTGLHYRNIKKIIKGIGKKLELSNSSEEKNAFLDDMENTLKSVKMVTQSFRKLGIK